MEGHNAGLQGITHSAWLAIQNSGMSVLRGRERSKKTRLTAPTQKALSDRGGAANNPPVRASSPAPTWRHTAAGERETSRNNERHSAGKKEAPEPPQRRTARHREIKHRAQNARKEKEGAHPAAVGAVYPGWFAPLLPPIGPRLAARSRDGEEWRERSS